MSKEKLEKLEREKYVVERKLTAAMHKEKRLQSELKRLTRSGRTHRLCTRAGMLETFLKEPTTLTDDDASLLPDHPYRKSGQSHEDYFGRGCGKTTRYWGNDYLRIQHHRCNPYKLANGA